MIDDDFVLTERSCAVFMRQICEGIEFMHGQKILHLDLKVSRLCRRSLKLEAYLDRDDPHDCLKLGTIYRLHCVATDEVLN